MQEFTYKQIEDDTYCVMRYKGDEPAVTVPDVHWGQSVTVIYDDLFRGHE